MRFDNAVVGGDPLAPSKVGSIDLHNMTLTMRGAGGELVTMDLAPADVHVPTSLPNYAAGYQLQDGCADRVCEPLLVPHLQDYIFTWDKKVAFQKAQSLVEGPGGVLPEITASIGKTLFTTAQYVTSAYMPTEVLANADSPISPDYVAMMRCMNAHAIGREDRVITLLTTQANWDSTVYLNLAAGQQWNSGASSDPIANIDAIREASVQGVTHMVMNRRVWNAFRRNAQVQKYTQFSDSTPSAPKDPTDMFGKGVKAFADLPIPIVSDMRALNSAGKYDYIWPDAVALVRSMPGSPLDQLTISTTKTFRWTGGGSLVKDRATQLPDGSMAGAGWVVRKFYDQKRGARGGMVTVVTVNDAEVMTSNIVGGLIASVIQ